jgi:hypothetical protein
MGRLMIKVTLALNAIPLDAAADFVKELPEFAQRVGLPIMERASGPMLAALQRYPAPPKYAYGKFPWKSERQRRAVMAKLGGRKYKRTFELRKAWRVEPRSDGNKLILSVFNLADAAQFVGGRFNQRSRAEAAIPVQPFHAPRWPLWADVVAPYFVKAKADFNKAVASGFNDAIRVKATKRSRFR